jgi:hypothetical protein
LNGSEFLLPARDIPTIAHENLPLIMTIVDSASRSNESSCRGKFVGIRMNAINELGGM